MRTIVENGRSFISATVGVFGGLGVAIAPQLSCQLMSITPYRVSSRAKGRLAPAPVIKIVPPQPATASAAGLSFLVFTDA